MSRSAHFVIGTGANPAIAAGAERYARQQGLERPVTRFNDIYMHPRMLAATAAAYNSLPEHDRAALPAFHAMRNETNRQFDYLTGSRARGGLGVNVEVTHEDPYSGPRELFRDLHENNRLRVLATSVTGGHPYFSNEENDRFRAVHDAFGHAGTGRGFDRHGEEAAFVAHSQMFSPMARRALATETRGQNTAMIAAGGQFQPQKIALLPQRFTTPIQRVAGRRSLGHDPTALLQARQFQQEQLGP